MGGHVSHSGKGNPAINSVADGFLLVLLPLSLHPFMIDRAQALWWTLVKLNVNPTDVVAAFNSLAVQQSKNIHIS